MDYNKLIFVEQHLHKNGHNFNRDEMITIIERIKRMDKHTLMSLYIYIYIYIYISIIRSSLTGVGSNFIRTKKTFNGEHLNFLVKHSM